MKNYLSSKYRNMRRKSFPVFKEKSTLSNAVPPLSDDAGSSQLQASTMCNTDQNSDLDTISYERNMKELLDEVDKPHPRAAVIKQLLKMTSTIRRVKINASTSSTVELVEEYKMFKDKNWVFFSVKNYY